MAQLLILTPVVNGEVLPSLGLLGHPTRLARLDAASLVMLSEAEVLFIDARRELAMAKAVCKAVAAAGDAVPVILVLTEGGLAAVSPEWGAVDVILDSSGPAEVDARIRLALGRSAPAPAAARIEASGLVIDEASYSARLRGRPLDLTYKEFELLRFLAAHPGRVYTREQLLSEVWGYDYFGGTRTVDVHVRRLRAKLGESESLIGTVRNVGYRFSPDEEDPTAGRGRSATPPPSPAA